MLQSSRNGPRGPRRSRKGRGDRAHRNGDTVTYGPLVRDPFPDLLFTKVRWSAPSVIRSTLALGYDYWSLRVNAPLGVDFNNALSASGLVPASFNYLCDSQALGPYRRYRVVGWDCVYTICNDSLYGIDIYTAEDELSTDTDTIGEAKTNSHVKRLVLDAKGGGNTRGYVRISGDTDRGIPAIIDGTFEYGNYNTNPTQGIYHNFYVESPAGPMRYFVTADITMRIQFFDRRMVK